MLLGGPPREQDGVVEAQIGQAAEAPHDTAARHVTTCRIVD
jgi:hypothetical protein